MYRLMLAQSCWIEKNRYIFNWTDMGDIIKTGEKNLRPDNPTNSGVFYLAINKNLSGVYSLLLT